jgi:hypothetical protein
LENTPGRGGGISANVIWGKKYEKRKTNRVKMQDKMEERERKRKKGKEKEKIRSKKKGKIGAK